MSVTFYYTLRTSTNSERVAYKCTKAEIRVKACRGADEPFATVLRNYPFTRVSVLSDE